MCEPTTVLAVGVGLASMAGAVQQGRNNKKIARNARLGAAANHNESNLQASQEVKSASQKTLENTMDAAEARATSRVSAGANGITGLSVDNVLHDISQKESEYNQSVLENNESVQLAINSQRASAVNRANSSINSLQQPDYLGAALKIGEPFMKKKKPPNSGTQT